MMTRVNTMGMTYSLHADYSGPKGLDGHAQKTIAILRGRKPKTVVLDMTLAEVSQCWYNWTMLGQHIQVAFAGLPADQREFLLSGITPEEWTKTFSGEEK